MKEQYVLRFSKDQFEKLARDVGANSNVSNNSTPIQVAHQLGVQHVLNKLREGFVVEG